MPVLGICNGFQILCESHLLPGALIRNDHRKFVCRDQRLRIENNRTAWTTAYATGAEITIVLKNGEGGYVADGPTLDRLEGEGRVVARYLDDNPNGSMRDIAGVTNERGNVVGLMPHPEHARGWTVTGSGTLRRPGSAEDRDVRQPTDEVTFPGGQVIFAYATSRPRPTCCSGARQDVHRHPVGLHAHPPLGSDSAPPGSVHFGHANLVSRGPRSSGACMVHPGLPINFDVVRPGLTEIIELAGVEASLTASRWPLARRAGRRRLL